MAKSLLGSFEALDDTTKDSLADLSSPRILSLAALHIAKNKCNVDELSAEHITACLEAAGVAVKQLSIARAMASAVGFVSSRKDDGGEVFYKIMTKGHREVEAVLGGSHMAVVRVEGNQPRTARLKLAEMLSSIKGTVRICDPYYGVRTLDTLDLIPRSSEILFLTMRSSEPERQLKGAFQDFKRERPRVEFRLAAKTATLHDRYLVTPDALLILGHGFKDLGGKESFIVSITKDISPDLIRDTISSFDSKWKDGTSM